MKSSRILLLLTTLLGVLASTSNAQKPKVEIFYETLNDAVRRFFIEQFRIVSENLVADIDLYLYPYGNTVKDGTTYTCPYGDLQCEANKIHGCVIVAETPADSPPNAAAIAKFANCFFKNRNANEGVNDLGEICLPGDAESDWGEIRICVLDLETNPTVVDYFGTITNDVAAEITVDGLVIRIADEISNAAKTNFVGEVCRALTKTDGICAQETTPSKVKIGVYYEAFNTDAGNYLTRQLGTYYHVLEDFIDIELIPYGNTQFDSASGYTCTNDPECISNKFQALVVHTYINQVTNGHPVSGPNRALNFVRCLFQSTIGNTFSALETCSNQNLDIDDYRTFLQHIKMDSDEIKTVFESMRTKTQQIAPNGLARVPIVTLNGEIDYYAFDDLVQDACIHYESTVKAGICTKVNVTVLYEALHHKSRTLFLEQLNPVFDNLYNLINLNLIPAGRADLLPGAGFVCPGGIEQCNAMKLQACALDFFWNDGNNYTDPIRQEVFDFIVCTFKNKKLQGVMDAAEACSFQHIETDAWFTIHGCLLDGTANGIFDEYIEETHSIIQNVENHAIPIVLINDREVTDLSSIKTQICQYFDEYHAPDYCLRDLASKVKIQVYYESMNELSKYFFTTQYDPWYIYVEEMVDIELFPAGNVREESNNGTCNSYDADSVCLANKIQAFVVDKYSLHDDDGDYIDGTLRTMRFLSCYFSHANFKDNAYLAAEYCTEETLLDDEWFDLITTVRSPAGDAIYKAVIDATEQFKTDNNLETLDPVPWVTLDNNKHSKRAADDLLQTVCSQYSGDKPVECNPVQVDVYYSAINPQSRRYFLDQLIPTFRALRERIHVTLIPFGIPNPSQTIEEECQNKDKICLANRVQACAIDKFFKDEVDVDNSIQWDGKNQTLAFITCMFKNMKNMDIMQLAEECGNNNIILAEEITLCAQQQEGLVLLGQMRDKSIGQYETMDHAPWVVVNGLHSDLGESDLKQAVCDHMMGDKPNYCFEPTPAKVKVDFHYSALDSNSASYVINELYPHYRALEEIIDLEVVPFGLTEVLNQGNGDYTLICPNGVNECRANLIHGCLYNQFYHNTDDGVSNNQEEYDGKLQFVEYVNCYFTSNKYPSQNVDAAEECVEQIFGDIFSTVHECSHSKNGTQILLDFQDHKVAALLPHLTYTPWMTVNGRHNYTIEHHIQRTVCNAYTGRYKPDDCYAIYDIDEKPVVEIHYEPHSADSKDFFTTKLVPEHITEIAEIRMVPFGRSTYTSETSKTCVNDETCQQYIEHACVIDLYFATEPIKTLGMIACTFGEFFEHENAVNECVNLIFEGDFWPTIETCVHERGDALLKANADLAASLLPKISHVPWINVNGEHNIEAEVNLVNELCGVYYPADKPAFCLPELIDVGVYYETMNTDVNNFFLGQLSQYGEYLDEIGKFTFIPYGTTRNNGGQFTCNKENQCTANIVHACILNRFYNRSSVNPDSEYEKNRIRFAGFLECTAFLEEVEVGSSDAITNANICLDRNFEGDLWRDIHFCYTGPEGAELYAEMARQTAALNPPLSTAPYITIGSTNNQNARTNLFQALCGSYSVVRPPLCATLPSLAVKVGIYFSGNAAGQTYINDHLLQFYREIVPLLREGTSEAKLHAVIAPEMVAWGQTQYDEASATNPFTCAGGVNECYINRFFACINHYHGAESKAILHVAEFTLCFFNQTNVLTNPQEAANICTNRVWIPDPYIELNSCATQISQENIDIFLKMKERTENNYPHFTSFPAVTINNQRDPIAEQNLLQSVCLNYKGFDTPAECAPFVTEPPTSPTTPVTTPTGPTVTVPTGPTVTGPTVTGPTVTGPTVTGPTVTGPTVTGPTVTGPTVTIPPTTVSPPGGSGTTPTISIIVLLVSFFICRLLC